MHDSDTLWCCWFGHCFSCFGASLVAQLVETCLQCGDLGSIPGLGRFPREGKGYPLQYSGLENSMGSQRVGHYWATLTFSFITSAVLAAITEYHSLHGVHSKDWFLTVLEAGKHVKMPADSLSDEDLPPPLQVTVFLLCPQRVKSRKRAWSEISSYEDRDPMHESSTLMT